MGTIIQRVLIIGIFGFLLRRFTPAKGIMNISTQEAKDEFTDKAVQSSDVRTTNEYTANHRKTFRKIPLANMKTRSSELDKQKEVVVICQSGMRSMQAAKLLKKQGFEKVTNVRGGMGSWV